MRPNALLYLSRLDAVGRCRARWQCNIFAFDFTIAEAYKKKHDNNLFITFSSSRVSVVSARMSYLASSPNYFHSDEKTKRQTG